MRNSRFKVKAVNRRNPVVKYAKMCKGHAHRDRKKDDYKRDDWVKEEW